MPPVPDWPSDRDRLSLQVLAGRIRAGNCVLLLGPGAATLQDDAERQPLESRLIAQLLADIGEPPPEPATDGAVPAPPVGLPLAAERWLKAVPDRDALSQQLVNFYATQGQTPTAMHLALARLPFALCISTTFDDQMFQAFVQAGKAPRPELYWPGTPRPPLTELPSAERPLVYHLFGHPSAPGSMALREGELIRAVAGIVRDQPPLPDVVRSALADPQTSCLFLGFGMHHWHLRLLLEVLQVFSNRSSRQLALEHVRVLAYPGHREAVELTYDEKVLELRPLNGEAFAKALSDAYARLSPAPAARPAVNLAAVPAPAAAQALPAVPLPSGVTQTMPAGGSGPKLPLVFLSYAHEDREAVVRLATELERRYLRVWRDDQNLRAGDNWEERLMSLIRKGVDYVAVVQTPTMARRTEGVFHQEIAAALARQKLMGYALDGTPLRFVLSVALGVAQPLPPLAPLHMIDVGSPEGIDGLAASVLEDWASRAKLRSSGAGKAA